MRTNRSRNCTRRLVPETGSSRNLGFRRAYRTAVRTLFAFSVLLMSFMASAQEDAQPWVRFGKDPSLQPIGAKVRLMVDSTGQMDVLRVMQEGEFRSTTFAVPNLGVSRAAHWAKFSMVNIHPEEEPCLLVDFPEIEELDVYLADASGVKLLRSAGQSRKVDPKLQSAPSFTIPLDVPFGGMATVYVRAKGDKQLQLPLYVITRNENSKIELDRNIFLGIYCGIMLAMILYNLFLYFSVMDRKNLYYVVAITFSLITQLSFTGYLGYYFFPSLPWASMHSSLVLTVCTAISANLFMDLFIGARKHVRHFLPVLYSFFALMGLGVLLDLLGFRVAAYLLVQLLSFVLAIFTLVVAIMVNRTGERSARFFLIAWCVFLTGIVVFVAKDWGVVPYNDLTKYMMSIGSAVEVLLLSLGLADRINVLRREKDRSQADALRTAHEKAVLVREQNVILELKVAERTHALQESNDHLKQTQSQLVSAEKMASLGQLTAGIAHEINNPINFISSSIPPLKRDLGDLREVLDAYREATKGQSALAPVHDMERRIGLEETVREVEEILAALENGAARTSEIVRGLRTFSRLDEDDLKEADINESLRGTVVVLGPQFRDAVKVDYDMHELPMLECYPGKLNQLFMNLLNNAAHAVKKQHGAQGGVVRITTKQVDGQVTVAIADNGVGMDGSVQSRLFEPFFTTKDVGEGTGLGLSIAKGIVDKHHGSITVQSEPGKGTIFTVSIPVNQPRQLAKSA